MPYYRALTDLHFGSQIVRKGTVLQRAFKESTLQTLITNGAIAPIHTPPLAALPDWATRAAKLVKLDITTAEQFLEADDAAVAKALKVAKPIVQQYKQEIIALWLTVDGKRKDCETCP